MKKPLLLSLFLLMLALLSGVKITQDLTQEKDLSVGDRFFFNIRADLGLKSVSVPDTITVFKVLKTERVSSPGKKAWLRLTIVPLFPGSHVFPRLNVQPDEPDGNAYHTDRFRIYVIPVRAVEDSLLVDIKPLARYPMQLPLWLYPLLFLAMLALIAAYFLLRRDKRKPAPPPPTPAAPEKPLPDPAWKQALRELDSLLELQLIARGEFSLHHFHLSHILRQFAETKYRFAAREMTTSEIKWVMERIHVDKSDEVLSFLRYCDRVKFARYIPSAEEVGSAESWLRAWLMAFEVAEARQALAAGSQKP